MKDLSVMDAIWPIEPEKSRDEQSGLYHRSADPLQDVIARLKV
jgi:hypothetical protein